MIYEKTGLIFLKQEYDFHFLIPDNLRDLNSLYVMLYSLENVDIKEPQKIDKKDKKKIKHNLRRFEDYFFNTWIKNNLSLIDQSIIEEFLSVDIRQKNKFIITTICSKHDFNSTKLEGEDENREEFGRVISKENKPLNVSLGDVLFFLYKVSLYDDSFNTKRFVFALKTIYSLTFYKLLFIEKEYENVQLLLGGSVYNPEYIGLIRRDKKNEKRSHFKIDYTTIVKYLLEKGKLHLVEWLHYFLIIVGTKEDKYRKEEEKYYDKTPHLGLGAIEVTTAVFDVLAFAFFTHNPERLLEKTFLKKDDYYKKILSDKISLYQYKRTLSWRERYRSALPIYSIEFLEKLLLSDLKRLKKKAEDYYAYFENFFDNLRGSIEDIIKNNRHINNIVLEAYDECPIVKVFREGKIPVPLINGLVNKGELKKLDEKDIPEEESFPNADGNVSSFEDASQTADEMESSEDDGQEDASINKIVGSLNDLINRYLEISTQEASTIKVSSIKNRITRFINGVKDLNIDKLEGEIKRADSLREEMNKLEDGDLEKVLNLCNDIKSLFRDKVEEINA